MPSLISPPELPPPSNSAGAITTLTVKASPAAADVPEAAALVEGAQPDPAPGAARGERLFQPKAAAKRGMGK